MIDPLHSLAFSVQANKGVYALLLGSGVSRSAKIPTGWEITQDLIRKLASIMRKDCGEDPSAWYQTEFHQAANYSKLLDELAKTQSERNQLLKNYWEPTESERVEGFKQPTKAHRAIAKLVEQGFIKIIITTNFDRLLEIALTDLGVTPTIICNVDQAKGALPLIHTKCCILKIHGDYLDTRILNTEDELNAYAPEFDLLLDRIFDEFGLITCGWSADWDFALCAAIYRCASRRFSTFWTHLGELGEAAGRLTVHRVANLIQIQGADEFFVVLQQQVESLEQFARPHPLSVEAILASSKRYLAESKYLIQLTDLVRENLDDVLQRAEKRFKIAGTNSCSAQEFTERVRAYEGICASVLALGPVLGFWSRSEHFFILTQSIERLSQVKERSGLVAWIDLQKYPGTLMLYSIGLGAVESGNLELLGKLLATIVDRQGNLDIPAAQALPPFALFSNGNDVSKMLMGMDQRYAPLNDWLFSLLREPCRSILPSDGRYELAFDKLEILFGLGYAFHAKRTKEWYWAPPGAFCYRRQNKERIFAEIVHSIDVEGNNSPFVKNRIFGSSVSECLEQLTAFKEFVEKVSARWW